MDRGLDLFSYGRKRSIKIRNEEETHGDTVPEQAESHLRSKRPCFISNAHKSRSGRDDMGQRQKALEFVGDSEVAYKYRNKGPLPEAVVEKNIYTSYESLGIPVLVEGVNADHAQVSLYGHLVKHFGPFVQSDSLRWRLSGDMGVVCLKKLLEIVTELECSQLTQLDIALLDTWEFQLSMMEGVGISVGWLRSYLARVRELGSTCSYLESELVRNWEELKVVQQKVAQCSLFR